MSKYQDQLINHITCNASFIQPSHRKNEILGFLGTVVFELETLKKKLEII